MTYPGKGQFMLNFPRLLRGSGVNAGTEDGRTPLHIAAWWCDNPAPLELLVRAGGNLRKKDKFGQNTLHWAARGGNYEIVKFVLDHRPGNYADTVHYQNVVKKMLSLISGKRVLQLLDNWE